MLDEFIPENKKEREEDRRLRDDLEKIKHVCKCGHPVYFSNRNDFSYCHYCWRRVYRDEATEFKHKMLRAMGQGSNNSRRFSNESRNTTKTTKSK